MQGEFKAAEPRAGACGPGAAAVLSGFSHTGGGLREKKKKQKREPGDPTRTPGAEGAR